MARTRDPWLDLLDDAARRHRRQRRAALVGGLTAIVLVELLTLTVHPPVIVGALVGLVAGYVAVRTALDLARRRR